MIKLNKIVILISALYLSGCFVSKDQYERKAMAASHLSKKLETSSKEVRDLQVRIVSLEAEIDSNKKKITELQSLINMNEEAINERDRTIDTLKSNLDIEIGMKNKDRIKVEDITRSQVDEIDILRRKKIELEDVARSLNKRIGEYETDTAKMRETIEKLNRENMDLLAIKAAQAREMNELMGQLAGANISKDMLTGIEKKLKKEIEKGQISASKQKDSLHVAISSDGMFESEDISVLKGEGKELVAKVVNALDKKGIKRIEVEGHTDNIGIGNKLRERYPTNWELSAMRAINVVKYITDELSIAPTIASAKGYASFKPVDTSDTDEGRKKNRRIEIAVYY